MLHWIWKRLTEMSTEAPIVFWSVIVLLTVEAGAVLVGPLVIPDSIYLRGYLSNEAKTNLEDFYTGSESALVFDEVCGWRNRPDFTRDKWVLDQYGGRSTHTIASEPGAKQRVLFLGSSLINGGTNVETSETISAMIEDANTESLNMGTMLYSLDQALLLYTSRLQDLGSDVVVVGLSGHPDEGLGCRFVPFYRRSETFMPYFKPRFQRLENRLELVPIPDREQCVTLLESPAQLKDLRDSDSYYGSFSSYQHYAFTPLARWAWRLSSRFSNLVPLLRWEDSDFDLLIALMHKVENEVRRDGARVVFLMLPDRGIAAPGWRGRLPDQYGRMVDHLRKEDFTVLDGRQVFRESNIATWELYHQDHQHLTPLGNRIIAAALKPML